MSQAIIASALDPAAMREAARIIRAGGLVAFPTETVYGLGADAENAVAVARIFEAKRRPRLDPLIVHVTDEVMARQYGVLPAASRSVCARFWPGPLTIVARRSDRVPPIVSAGLDTVALRVPAHPAALELIRASGRAIAAPSANPFGYVSPTEASHVVEQLGDTVDLILDGGPSAVGVESTILDFAENGPVILRAGGTPPEELEALLGPVAIQIGTATRPQAPGQLRRHYATRTPLDIVPRSFPATPPAAAGERIGLLTLTLDEDAAPYTVVEELAPDGDLRVAAARLFGALRRLDASALDRIIARPAPAKGLGLAIMDRLRRAAARD